MPDLTIIQNLPPHAYLLACFDYDPETGRFTWNTRPREHFTNARTWAMWNTKYASQPAGFVDKLGYRRVCFYNTNLYAHRIIWKLVTKEEPPQTIDHIDGDPSNNRFSNLRPANLTQQRWNARLRKDNASGFIGIQCRPSGKYRARIWMNGKLHSLSGFDTAEEAAAARDAIVRKLHGPFFR